MKSGRIASLFFAVAIAVALAAGSGYKLFQQGLAKERAEADLRGAIQIYEQVVSESAADRKLAAQALFRIGECQTALGDPVARKIYERVVNEYPEQKEVFAEAQARLAATRGPSAGDTLTFRRVWSGPKVDTEGTISSDGRFLSFPDWSTGNLAIRDLATGTDRTLTNDGSSNEYAERSVISPDGTLVAFARWNGKDHYELRLAGALGNAPAPSRPLYSNRDDSWLAPNSWSPDGNWIAVQINRKDATSLIGLVSAEDGSLTVLKSVDWRGPGKIAFSPDGRFLAYDLPAEDQSLQRDVFVLAVDGSQEFPVVVHPANDSVLGWSPDGNLVLFCSDRTGANGIWVIPVSGGKPLGVPTLLRPGIGEVAPLGLTEDGALYLGSRVGGPEIHVVTFDFEEGKRLSDPTTPIPEHVFTNRFPVWSPDGTQMAYISRRNILGPADYRIELLSINTNKVRELPTDLNYAFRPRWSSDGRFLAVNGTDAKGRGGLYRVDARTGQSFAIVHAEPNGSIDGSDWSPDGRKVYYRRWFADEDTVLIERELVSGVEREVLRRAGLLPGDLSPDGNWIVVRSRSDSADSTSLLLVHVGDGTTTELLRVEGTLLPPTWTPDSDSILIPRKGTVISKISVPGGEAKTIDLGFVARQFSIHPDGKQIAYPVGRTTFEVWALENFLPKPSAKK